eukprot:6927399-Lingulodinium_polyedra.AAC.1
MKPERPGGVSPPSSAATGWRSTRISHTSSASRRAISQQRGQDGRFGHLWAKGCAEERDIFG